MDIEPNSNDDVLEDVVIDRPYTAENAGNGINIYLKAVPGPVAKRVSITINDAVDKLQDFTTSQDAIERTFSKLNTVTRGSKLFDAMAIGVETGRNPGGCGDPSPEFRRSGEKGIDEGASR